MIRRLNNLLVQRNCYSYPVFQNYNLGSMLTAIQRAVGAYEEKEAWQKVMQRIMALDFSWQASAKKYEALYYKALELEGYAGR